MAIADIQISSASKVAAHHQCLTAPDNISFTQHTDINVQINMINTMTIKILNI